MEKPEWKFWPTQYVVQLGQEINFSPLFSAGHPNIYKPTIILEFSLRIIFHQLHGFFAAEGEGLDGQVLLDDGRHFLLNGGQVVGSELHIAKVDVIVEALLGGGTVGKVSLRIQVGSPWKSIDMMKLSGHKSHVWPCPVIPLMFILSYTKGQNMVCVCLCYNPKKEQLKTHASRSRRPQLTLEDGLSTCSTITASIQGPGCKFLHQLLLKTLFNSKKE